MKGKCNERKCSMVRVLVTRRLLRRTASGQRLWTGRLRGQDCQVKPGHGSFSSTTIISCFTLCSPSGWGSFPFPSCR